MMTIKATSTTVHERKHRVIIPHKALERAIAEEAARAVQFDKPRITRTGVSYTVTFEDETEGSPPYKVGTRAIVTIIEDMCPQDAAQEPSNER
jgi:hypothetical protein